jgi:hypothetical protein
VASPTFKGSSHPQSQFPVVLGLSRGIIISVLFPSSILEKLEDFEYLMLVDVNLIINI